MSEWIRDYYDDVDNMRLGELVARHSDDAVVHFANNPPVRGKDEIVESSRQFWSMIGGLEHTFVNTWEVDGTTILEASIDYTRADGSHVIVPSACLAADLLGVQAVDLDQSRFDRLDRDIGCREQLGKLGGLG